MKPSHLKLLVDPPPHSGLHVQIETNGVVISNRPLATEQEAQDRGEPYLHFQPSGGGPPGWLPAIRAVLLATGVMVLAANLLFLTLLIHGVVTEPGRAPQGATLHVMLALGIAVSAAALGWLWFIPKVFRIIHGMLEPWRLAIDDRLCLHIRQADPAHPPQEIARCLLHSIEQLHRDRDRRLYAQAGHERIMLTGPLTPAAADWLLPALRAALVPPGKEAKG
jgi:hypothetical protein